MIVIKANNRGRHCYEVSGIDIIKKIKQIPENIDGLFNNLAKDYSMNIPD